jgi:hypothetical protein
MSASVFDSSAPNLGPFAVQNPARAPFTPNVLYLSDGKARWYQPRGRRELLSNFSGTEWTPRFVLPSRRGLKGHYAPSVLGCARFTDSAIQLVALLNLAINLRLAFSSRVLDPSSSTKRNQLPIQQVEACKFSTENPSS